MTPRSVQLAEKGKFMKATCEGDLKVVSEVNNKEVDIIIKNVLCVPDLRINLLSISTIEKAGFEIKYFNSKIVIKRGNTIYIEGNRCNNLYRIILRHCSSEYANLAVNNEKELWRQRYGHLNYNSLLKIKNNNLVNGMQFANSGNDSLCEICVKSKLKCLPYFFKSTKSSRILEIIHTDVCGPITPTSHNGNCYFVTFVDDYSRFVMVYVIRHKSEVFNCIKDYEAKVTSLFCGKKISKINCDNGGEYCSKNFIEFCSQKGIQICYTPPYTPQLNGVAERMNQTLMDKARSMINQANMDKSFWEEAVLVAAYINNRTQSCVNKEKTPYDLWLNKKPNVSNMKVFGCIAYARVPDTLRVKLDDKGLKCRFIGYTENGYKLWNESENKSIHSRNVIFNESNFMYSPYKRQAENDWDSTDDIENGSSKKMEQTNADEITERENNLDNIEENTRLRRQTRLPAKFNDYELDISCLALLSEFTNVPQSYSRAKQSSNWNHWEKAINDELNALNNNSTWELIEKPEKEVIGNSTKGME